jgi:hypothetical protein
LGTAIDTGKGFEGREDTEDGRSGIKAVRTRRLRIDGLGVGGVKRKQLNEVVLLTGEVIPESRAGSNAGAEDRQRGDGNRTGAGLDHFLHRDFAVGSQGRSIEERAVDVGRAVIVGNLIEIENRLK